VNIAQAAPGLGAGVFTDLRENKKRAKIKKRAPPLKRAFAPTAFPKMARAAILAKINPREALAPFWEKREGAARERVSGKILGKWRLYFFPARLATG
jgi:hypothetical protein